MVAGTIFAVLGTAVLAALLGALLWLFSRSSYWSKKGVATVSWWRFLADGHPFKGTIPAMGFLYSECRRAGVDYMGFKFCKFMVVADPTLVNNILVADFDHFVARGFYSNQDRDYVALNLFHLDGDQWRTIRSKMTPYFTPSRVRGMLRFAENSMVHLENVIERESPTMDIDDSALRFTTDVLTGSVFGVKSDAFTEKDSVYVAMQRALFSPEFTGRFYLSMASPRLYDLLRLTVVGPRVSRFIMDLTRGVIDQRTRDTERRNDFIQSMIDLKEKDEKTPKEDREKYLPDGSKALKFDVGLAASQLTVLFAGGTESSSSALAFALYELALDQDMQEKARREVHQVLAQSGTLDYEAIQSAKYVNMIISESLRKYSPFALLNRMCTKEYTLPDTGITIEPGTIVLIPVYGLHHDPRYYPDPERFIPERFTEEETGNRPQGSYLPFGLGPRICIGMKFALAEISLALCRLLMKYRFTACSKTEVPLVLKPGQFLTQPQGGIWLSVERLTEC